MSTVLMRMHNYIGYVYTPVAHGTGAAHALAAREVDQVEGARLDDLLLVQRLLFHEDFEREDLYTYIYLYVNAYLYIYISICMCVCVYIYIYNDDLLLVQRLLFHEDFERADLHR